LQQKYRGFASANGSTLQTYALNEQLWRLSNSKLYEENTQA